ncbi:conserved hypothetical protein [Ricinus communis]|uniref:Uncharacterized protein n=1 Tax=Ricinus communis TaxID=3988 RepID=B9RRE4_RICCO|nr:conserved hypothetical protein [Ricinus communis]
MKNLEWLSVNKTTPRDPYFNPMTVNNDDSIGRKYEVMNDHNIGNLSDDESTNFQSEEEDLIEDKSEEEEDVG